MNKFLFLCGIFVSVMALDSYNKTQRLEFYDFSKDVHYSSVSRGDLLEEIFAPLDAIRAIQNNQKIPLDTTITLIEYKGNKTKLNRTLFMRKTTLGWVFEEFDAQNKMSVNDDTKRCFSCHASSIDSEDIIFTLSSMNKLDLGEIR